MTGKTGASLAGQTAGEGDALVHAEQGHVQIIETAKSKRTGTLHVIGQTADTAEGAEIENNVAQEGTNGSTFNGNVTTTDKPFAVQVTSEKGDAKITDKANIHILPSATEPVFGPIEAPKPNVYANGHAGAVYNPNIKGDARGYVQTEGHAVVRPKMEGITLQVFAETGEVGGDIKLSQDERALTLKGKFIFDKNAKLAVGGNPVGPNEDAIDALNKQIAEKAQAAEPAPVQEAAPQETETAKKATPEEELLQNLQDNPNLLSQSQKVRHPKKKSEEPKQDDEKKDKHHHKKGHHHKKKGHHSKKHSQDDSLKQMLKDNPNLLSRSHKVRHHKKKDKTPQQQVQGPQEEAPTPPQQPETPVVSEPTPADTKAPTPPAPPKPEPKFSVVIDGKTKLDGHIALTHGIGVVDRPAEDANAADTEERGITLGSNLHLTGGGDLVGNTAGKVTKEAGSYVGMKNIYLNGDEGAHMEGKSVAQETFLVTSKKDIVEGDTSVTKAGGSVGFYTEGKMFKQEGAVASAPVIFRHGEQGGNCAGDISAGVVSSVTNGSGKLTVEGSTKGTAHTFRIGSFTEMPKPEPEQEKPAPVDPQNPDATETQPVETEKEEKKKHRHKSHKANPASRSKTDTSKAMRKHSKKQKMLREIGKDDGSEKPEVEKPKPSMPSLDNAGEVDLQKGISLKGRELYLSGKGIDHLEDLFTQSGFFENLDISDFIFAHTDQAAHFMESAKSAAKGFELHASKVDVGKKVKLEAPEVLRLHSIDHDMTLSRGAHLKAGVYLELLSDKDIVGEFKKKIKTNEHGEQTVKFKGVTLEGGTGFKYVYTDPKTGEKSERYVGLCVDANGRITATGMKLTAPADIHMHGFDGIENKGAAQTFVKEFKEESNLWRDKTKTKYDTAFFSPNVFTGGKLIMSSENGGLLWQGGTFMAGEGADLLFNGHVRFLPLKGWHGTRTERDTLITFADTEDYSYHGLAPSTLFVNAGETPVRIWTSDKHDIIAPGLIYAGEEGTLDTRGRYGYFTRLKLKHETHSTSTHGSLDYSIMGHLKSLGALKDAKNFIHNMANNNWGGALQDAVKPSVRAGLNWTTSHRNWETLSGGSISSKNWIVNFKKGLITDNAYGVCVTGDFISESLPYWYQGGAKLRSSFNTRSFGIYAGGDGSGPNVGATYGQSSGKSSHWVPSYYETMGANGNVRQHKNIFLQNFVGDAGTIEQDAAHMHIGKLDGSIDKIISRTHKDRSQSSGFNMGIQYGFGGASGSASGHFNTSAQTNHVSGVTIGEYTDRARIGHAHLVGAKIIGITPESQTYIPLSKDYNVGGQLGFSGTRQGGLQNIMVGVSKDGKQVQLSLSVAALTDKGTAETDPRSQSGTIAGRLFNQTEPWKQIGTITVNGVELPIITDINPQFFNELSNDLQTLNNKIFGTVGQTLQENLPSAYMPPQREVWTPVQEQPLEPEVPVVDVPYNEKPAQPHNPVEDIHDQLDQMDSQPARPVPFDQVLAHVDNVLTQGQSSPEQGLIPFIDEEAREKALIGQMLQEDYLKPETSEFQWPIPEALADTVTGAASMFVVKRPLNYVLKHTLGGMAKWICRGLSLGGKLIPEVPSAEWESAYNDLKEAREAGNYGLMQTAVVKLEMLGQQEATKIILTSPNAMGEWVDDYFFSDYKDQIQLGVEDMGPAIEQGIISHLNSMLEGTGIDPVSRKTGNEIQQGIDANRHSDQHKANPCDFIEGVENVLYGVRQGTSGMVIVPFLPKANVAPVSQTPEYPIVIRSPSKPTPGNRGVEELFKPFNLDGAEYKFRSGNTYLQDKALLEPFENARQRIFSSNSTYGPRALLDFELHGTPLFLRDSHALLPYESELGLFDPYKTYKGRSIHGPKGTFNLGDAHIELAAFPKRFGLFETFAHEIEHDYWFRMNKGESLIPGFVSGNRALTEANSTRLLQAYAQEYISLGTKGQLHGRWTPEGPTFFNALGYFEPTLENILNDYSIPLPAKLGEFKDLFLEEAYYGRRLSYHPSLRSEFRYPIWCAENTIAREIPAHLAQIDVKNTKWIYTNAPQTHALLEEFGRPAFKATSPKPAVFDSTLPSMTAPSSSWQGVERLGKLSLPFLDLIFHVGSEAFNGHDFPDSIAIGSAKTVIDTAVYGGFYGAAGYIAGGPLAWVAGGLMAADTILPSYSDKEIYDCYRGNNTFDGGLSHELAEGMVVLNAIHGAAKWSGIRWIGEKLYAGSEFVYHKFDDTFPTALPFVSACIQYAQIRELNENARYLESMGFVSDKLPVRNPREIFEEVDTKYKASLNEKKSASSSDKGKEEL